LDLNYDIVLLELTNHMAVANFNFEKQIKTTISILSDGKVINKLEGGWITLDNNETHSKKNKSGLWK